MIPVDFIHSLTWRDLPTAVQTRTQHCLLDLIGVACGGLATDLSRIIRGHASDMFGGTAPQLFDARTASPAGVALAAGMTIDALDGHDGYNPAKGHIGCVMVPAALAVAQKSGSSGENLLSTIAMGYEFGSRVAVAQHETVADYHTSGSWGAVAAAAACARLMALDTGTTRHALGIAEYHGPRSQMMRCIDHPTMLKDGSGWGAMAGVSAASLAAKGFTGAPAITVEETPDAWQTLGTHWLILDQYFKPYPVCRWAQAPVEGVLTLRAQHDLVSADLDHIEVETFHEAVRLATARPRNTEEAQYSTSFPSAVAMVRGEVTPQDVDGAILQDPEVLRLSTSLQMRETDWANANFPAERQARVTLVLRSGDRLTGDILNPKWDHRVPPSDTELRAKFHDLADPVLGHGRASRIEEAIDKLHRTDMTELADQLFAPIN